MSRPRRPPVIGYVLQCGTVGGGEVATLRVARALAERRRFHPVALCLDGSAVLRAFESASIETVPFTPAEFSYRRGWRYARSVVTIARTIRRLGIDLVHCSDLMSAYHAALAARLAGVPVLSHIRSLFPPHEILPHHKPPIAAVQHFLFSSRAVWTNFNRIYRVPEPRGTVVYDGGPGADVPSDEVVQAVRRELDLPDSAVVIGMVARIASPKDFDTLIDAFDRVLATYPAARLLLVGDAQDRNYANSLRAKVDANGLSGHVRWTGFRADVPALLRAMDVVVLSTRSEGFGLVILEAMEQSRPVVATRVGGVPEIITDGQNGLLHEAGDAEGLAGALRRLIANRRLASEIAENGRAMVQTRFTVDRTVSTVSDLYDRFLWRDRVVAAQQRTAV